MASLFSRSSPKKKTAVLVITTHGDFKVKGAIKVKVASTDVLEPQTIVKPDDMDIVILQAATCGIVNIIAPIQVVSYTKNIRDNTYGFDANTSKDNMVKIVESIKETIMRSDIQPDIVSKEVYSGNPNYIDDSQYMGYYYHNDKSYTVSSDDIIINKRFSRNSTQTKSGSRDWKVNLLGETMGSDEDLMVTLKPSLLGLRPKERDEIMYMSDIIFELKKREIEKVLIFDFTCSVVKNNVNERYVRQLRRSMNQGLYSMQKGGIINIFPKKITKHGRRRKKKTKRNTNRKTKRNTNRKTKRHA